MTPQEIKDLRKAMHTRELTCIELHNILDAAESNLSSVELAEIATAMRALQKQADELALRCDARLTANMRIQADLTTLRQLQQREQAWRNALQWLVLQLYQERCTRDAEGADETTDCTETGACLTEYCLPCYARKMMQALKGGVSDV